MARKTRGEQRFASITYRQLADWTGLTLETIRNYGANGRIPKHNLQATIQWVNERREAKGLPLIGDPNAEPIPTTPDSPTTETDTAQTTPDQDNLDRITPASPHPPSCRCHVCYLASKSKRA